MMVWILTAGFGTAAPKKLVFGSTVVLKEEGLKFKTLSGAKAQILPPPTVHHYTDGAGRQSERYDPRELWYASQYRGQWVNPAGQTLILAVIEKSLPRNFPGQHVRREAYDAALSSAPDPLSNNETLLVWLNDFAGAAVKGKLRSLPDSFRLQKVMAIEFEGQDPARIGYLFSLKPTPVRAAPERRFFALLEWSDTLSSDDVIRAVESDFLPSVEASSGAASEPLAASARMQNKAVAGKVERSAEFLQSRENAINSIKGMKNWWFAETANYVLVSDLPASQRQFVRQLQADLEFLHTACMQILPPRVPIEAVSVVRIFSKTNDYDQYVGLDDSWSLGHWMPGKNELVIKTVTWGDANQRREIMTEMVYHEAFHQYLFYAFDKIDVPIWYNEGYAAFCEGIQITKKGFEVDEVERRYWVVEEMIAKKKINFRSLIMMNSDDFYAQGRKETCQEHYALAWGLVYYLCLGAPLEKKHAYGRLLEDYADSLFQNRNAEEANRKILESVDTVQFAAAFRDFWKSEQRRQAARRNAIFKNVVTNLPPE